MSTLRGEILPYNTKQHIEKVVGYKSVFENPHLHCKCGQKKNRNIKLSSQHRCDYNACVAGVLHICALTYFNASATIMLLRCA